MSRSILKHVASQDGFEVLADDRSLSQADLELLFDSLDCSNSSLKPAEVLAGRGTVQQLALPNCGQVVLKEYRRGGVLQHFVLRYYLRLGASRAAEEFDILKKVRALGVAAPEPVAIIERGSLFYRNWILMRKVTTEESMANLSPELFEELPILVAELVRQLALLIHARVFHVDLHPGNVLVDREKKIYILDFDKAYAFNGTANELRDQYLFRWRRAVIKHGLSEELNELLAHGLRQNFSRLEEEQGG